MRVSPGIYHAAPAIWCDELQSHIDFWYDSLCDCYRNLMPTEMILSYIDAIDTEDFDHD